MQGNQLQDLKATLAVLSQLHSLRKLGLSNNPLALEGSYREATIFAIPSLEHLDSFAVTPVERQAAVKFFTAKRIEKKYAFGTIPKIWDKPEIIKIGDPSVGELDLRREIRASTRRRQIAAEEQQAKELREASRPRFEINYAKGATGLLSAQAGARSLPTRPLSLWRVAGFLTCSSSLASTMSSAGKRQAAALGEAGQGDAWNAKVHVAVTAMGVLPAPLLSRDVLPRQLGADDEAAFLRFEEFLFSDAIYADAYDKVQQLKTMGKLDEINVGVALRESSTSQTIGVARIPLMALLQEHVEKQYNFEQVPLYPPGHSAEVPADQPIAHLSLSLTTDWGLSNTCAGEYGNSAFHFARQRRAKAESKASGGKKAPTTPQPSAAVAPPPPTTVVTSKRLARDFLTVKNTTSVAAVNGDDGQAALAALAPTGFKFDAEGYAKFLAKKKSLQPRESREINVPL